MSDIALPGSQGRLYKKLYLAKVLLPCKNFLSFRVNVSKYYERKSGADKKVGLQMYYN